MESGTQSTSKYMYIPCSQLHALCPEKPKSTEKTKGTRNGVQRRARSCYSRHVVAVVSC